MPKEKKPKDKEKSIENKKLSQLEYEKKIAELSEKGLSSEKIGQALKLEGIHAKDYNRKISKILKDKKRYINTDLKNIENKLQKIDKHYEKNKHDRRAMREKVRVAAQLKKLKSYFEKRERK